MVSQQLASWQARNHYRSDDDVVYGVYQNCGFSVSDDDGGLLFVFMLSPRDDDAFDDLEDALADEGGEIAEAQVGDVEGYLALFFDQSNGAVSQRTMNSLLDFVADQARSCGFRVPNICVKCGARATKRSFVDGMVQPLCADCSAQNRESRRAAAEKNQNPPRKEQRSRYDDDDRYAQQYTPITADSSKYDDSYDEYAGMEAGHGDYRTTQYPPRRDPEEPPKKSREESREPLPRFDQTPIAFNDDGEEDYQEILGSAGEHSATVSEKHIGGSAAMGVLGTILGSLVGVIPYAVIALGLHFPMAALCFPAGILAVWCYTALKGRKSMGFGMGVSIACSAVISFFAMFLCMVVYYMNENRNFSQAMNYLFSENGSFFAFNTIFAVLGAAFGALFMIVAMSKYIESDD